MAARTPGPSAGSARRGGDGIGGRGEGSGGGSGGGGVVAFVEAGEFQAVQSSVNSGLWPSAWVVAIMGGIVRHSWWCRSFYGKSHEISLS